MPDPEPLGDSDVFRGARRRSSDPEEILQPSGDPTARAADLPGSARQQVVLLGLLQRIQILEGIASQDRTERLFAQETAGVSEGEREATEQRLSVAFTQIAEVARIAGELNRDATIVRDFFIRDQDQTHQQDNGTVRSSAVRAVNGSAGLSRIKPRF